MSRGLYFFYENLTESGNRNEAVSWKGMSLTGCWKRVFRMASAYLRCMRISDMRSMENYLILFPVFGLFAVGGKETLLFHAGSMLSVRNLRLDSTGKMIIVRK